MFASRLVWKHFNRLILMNLEKIVLQKIVHIGLKKLCRGGRKVQSHFSLFLCHCALRESHGSRGKNNVNRKCCNAAKY